MKKTAPFLVFALVLLVNPNVNVFDILPDFIAYFIFARLLTKPADCAPYFEEARESALKLAWITLAKIPASFLVLYIRSHNTFDRDIYPLVSLVFAILEIIFILQFVKNLSSALFHLGERGTAQSLIAPFNTSKSSYRPLRPEDLRTYTIMFAVCKCILYALPEFLLLSGTTSDGTLKPSPMQRYYPWTLLAALAIGTVLGVIWILRAVKYARAVADEGKFTESLELLAREDAAASYEKKTALRSIRTSMLFFFTASILSIRIALRETNDINILPGVFFAAALIFALCKIKDFMKSSIRITAITAAVYSFLSIASLILLVRFNDKYTYMSLLGNDKAQTEYIIIIIVSALEFVALAALLVFTTLHLFSFIEEKTGVSPTAERYGITEQIYHRELKKKAIIMSSLGLLVGLAKLADIILKFFPKITYTDVGTGAATVVSSPLPWFNVVILAISVLYIGFSYYYTGILKEECELKYAK